MQIAKLTPLKFATTKKTDRRAFRFEVMAATNLTAEPHGQQQWLCRVWFGSRVLCNQTRAVHDQIG